MSEFLTIDEVAQRLRVCRRHVLKVVLPYVEHLRLGAVYRIRADSFEAWLERSQRPALLASMRRAERKSLKVPDYVNGAQ